MGAADQAMSDAILRTAEQGGPTGVTHTDLLDRVAGLTLENLEHLLNSLLRAHRIEILGHATDGSTLRYKFIPRETALLLKNMSQEDYMVFQLVRESKNDGIWSRDLKLKSQMQHVQLGKILKHLETKGLIKSVRSVEGASRKVYMLAELEPARTVTGGAWYTDRNLDSEFINQAREICIQVISKEGSTSLDRIVQFIRDRRVFNVELSPDDIMSVIQTLIYDGKVVEEPGPDEDGEESYRLAKSNANSSAFGNLPCGVCPVIHQCAPDGYISPQNCEYFTAWLEHF